MIDHGENRGISFCKFNRRVKDSNSTEGLEGQQFNGGVKDSNSAKVVEGQQPERIPHSRGRSYARLTE